MPATTGAIVNRVIWGISLFSGDMMLVRFTLLRTFDTKDLLDLWKFEWLAPRRLE